MSRVGEDKIGPFVALGVECSEISLACEEGGEMVLAGECEGGFGGSRHCLGW